MTKMKNGKVSIGLVLVIASLSVAGAWFIIHRGLYEKKNLYAVRVTFLAGSAVMSRQSNEVTLMPGDTLKEGDVIRTGKNSRVVAQVNRLGVLTILADTTVRLKEFQGGKLKAVTLALDKGRLFSRILKQKRGTYRVETPTSTAAVRGTSFLSTADRQGSSHRLLEGKVLVTSSTKKEGETEKILERGFAAVAEKDEKITISKMEKIDRLEAEKAGLYPYREKFDEERSREIERDVEDKEEKLEREIKQELDKLPPLEKLRRQGKPLTMLYLKDGSRFTGYVVSSDQKILHFDTGGKVLSIEVKDVRRRVPVK